MGTILRFLLWATWNLIQYGSGEPNLSSSLKDCRDTFVEVVTSRTIGLPCEHELGYQYDDGETQKVSSTFHDTHYSLILNDPKSFPINDTSGCELADIGDRVHKISIFFAPTFDNENGCGIEVDGNFLFGAVVIHTKNDHNKPVDTGRVLFPIQKSSRNSDINVTTAFDISHTNGSSFFVPIGELHRLSDVNETSAAFGYLYFETVVKMFLDLPIQITEDVYNILKDKNSPVPVKSEHCDNVYHLFESYAEKTTIKPWNFVGCLLWSVNRWSHLSH